MRSGSRSGSLLRGEIQIADFLRHIHHLRRELITLCVDTQNISCAGLHIGKSVVAERIAERDSGLTVEVS